MKSYLESNFDPLLEHTQLGAVLVGAGLLGWALYSQGVDDAKEVAATVGSSVAAGSPDPNDPCGPQNASSYRDATGKKITENVKPGQNAKLSECFGSRLRPGNPDALRYLDPNNIREYVRLARIELANGRNVPFQEQRIIDANRALELLGEPPC